MATEINDFSSKRNGIQNMTILNMKHISMQDFLNMHTSVLIFTDCQPILSDEHYLRVVGNYNYYNSILI